MHFGYGGCCNALFIKQLNYIDDEHITASGECYRFNRSLVAQTEENGRTMGVGCKVLMLITDSEVIALWPLDAQAAFQGRLDIIKQAVHITQQASFISSPILAIPQGNGPLGGSIQYHPLRR